jgi:hypothetical protein
MAPIQHNRRKKMQSGGTIGGATKLQCGPKHENVTRPGAGR